MDTPDHASRHPASVPQLRMLLLTDLVDSTGLVERIGDMPAAELFREHDRLVLKLQQQWRGRLIDRSDGLLLLFERPIDGLGFALDYNRGLAGIGLARNLKLQARAGLHFGEVLTWRNSDEAVSVGAKPLEVEGLAKPMAGRLMAMARPGQILLSAVAEPLAHRAARELGERGQQLLWKSHGRWRFKGVPSVQEVYEVGEPGVAPLRAPPSTPKAWRDLPLWRRPAALAAEVALVIGIGIGVWFVTKPQPALAFGERDWVVVGDLRNLTGQKVLDDALEQAFRISLEQSRYVNVLSDLKARDTLARMQRKPGTLLDRAIASEIALRDGARAVILPTVAEVGGRVRVSVEVVDPHTQATVYAESADGTGAGSVLDSIDTVTAALRGKLGEAVKSIEMDSAPLPQVATNNLDALRAYALGVKAYGNGQYEEALQYFERATQLDPEFALAYMGAVRIHVSNVKTELARDSLARALALRGRLPARDALYLDAWSAEFQPQAARRAPEKWKLLAGMYPDYYAGHANYSWGAFYLGRYDDALRSARAATAPQNSLRAIAFDQVGRIQLARDEYADALANFSQAATGNRNGSRQMAAAYAATGDFAKAHALLGKLPRGDLATHIERITIQLDQGRPADALRAAAQAEALARNSGAFWRNLFQVIGLSIETAHGRDLPSARRYQHAIDAALEGLEPPGAADRTERLYFALAATYLAQRAARGDVSERNLPRLAKLVSQVDDPRTDEMLTILRASQRRLDGDADAAAALLEPMIDGHELFQVHAALRDALRAGGHREAAQQQDRWLAEHRGRAYAEQAGVYVLQATNVADTATPGWIPQTAKRGK